MYIGGHGDFIAALMADREQGAWRVHQVWYQHTCAYDELEIDLADIKESTTTSSHVGWACVKGKGSECVPNEADTTALHKLAAVCPYAILLIIQTATGVNRTFTASVPDATEPDKYLFPDGGGLIEVSIRTLAIKGTHGKYTFSTPKAEEATAHYNLRGTIRDALMSKRLTGSQTFPTRRTNSTTSITGSSPSITGSTPSITGSTPCITGSLGSLELIPCAWNAWNMPRDGRCWFHCYNATEYLELWRAKPRKETGYACAPDDIIAEEAAVASLVDFVSQEGAKDPDPKVRIRAEEIAGGDIVGLDDMPWLCKMFNVYQVLRIHPRSNHHYPNLEAASATRHLEYSQNDITYHKK